MCDLYLATFPIVKLLLSGVAVCGVAGHELSVRQKRVVGGHISQPNQWPWMVSMELWHVIDNKWEKLEACGATLITRKHLLTAGHCIEK